MERGFWFSKLQIGRQKLGSLGLLYVDCDCSPWEFGNLGEHKPPDGVEVDLKHCRFRFVCSRSVSVVGQPTLLFEVLTQIQSQPQVEHWNVKVRSCVTDLKIDFKHESYEGTYMMSESVSPFAYCV